MTPNLAQRVGFRIVGLPRRPIVADRSLLLLGALKRVGWTRSIAEGAPVDERGSPLPWWTYAAIHFVERALDGTELVFEYGSGQSTKWLAQRARKVHSVEHDEHWFAKVSSGLSDNAVVVHRSCGGDGLRAAAGDSYVEALTEMHGADVIIVDGRARLSCVEAVCRVATGNELIVLDDSHRPAYAPALDHLKQLGFARIDFVGPVPGRTNFSTTSVFSKDLQRWAAPRMPPEDWDNAI